MLERITRSVGERKFAKGTEISAVRIVEGSKHGRVLGRETLPQPENVASTPVHEIIDLSGTHPKNEDPRWGRLREALYGSPHFPVPQREIKQGLDALEEKSPEARELIDKTIVNGESLTEIANQQGTNRQGVRSKLTNAQEHLRRLVAGAELPQKGKPKSKEVADRREQVAEAMARGLTPREIHKATGISLRLVNTDVSRLRREAGVPTQPRSEMHRRTQEERDRHRGELTDLLSNPELSNEDIIARLGVTPGIFRTDREFLEREAVAKVYAEAAAVMGKEVSGLNPQEKWDILTKARKHFKATVLKPLLQDAEKLPRFSDEAKRKRQQHEMIMKRHPILTGLNHEWRIVDDELTDFESAQEEPKVFDTEDTIDAARKSEPDFTTKNATQKTK